VRGRRDRIASPAQAAALVAALPVAERALWATALYAGLRRGELRALRWNDVDFDAGVIRVERGWDDDPKVGEIAVKSDAGRRAVPLIGVLRRIIATHKLATGRYIGHSDIRTTYNRYGHLMPGGEAQAAAQVDAYLEAAQSAALTES